MLLGSSVAGYQYDKTLMRILMDFRKIYQNNINNNYEVLNAGIGGFASNQNLF